MKEAELFNGTILEFPDNTPDSVIDKAVQKETFRAKKMAEYSNIDPTKGMSGLETYAAGLGKTVVDYGRGIRHLLPGDNTELNQEIDESRRLDAPLMETAGGISGNITGHVLAALTPGLGLATAGKLLAAPKIANAGKALLSTPLSAKGALIGGSQGAALASLQPVATGETRQQNALVGGLGGALIPALGTTVKGAKAIAEPLYKGGKEAILSRALRGAAGTGADDAARSMSSATELVPGSHPTAGQVSGNAGIAAMERAAKAVDPSAYGERQVAQNAARLAALKSVAGDENSLSAAIQARSKAVAPLAKQVSDSTAQADPTRVANLIDRIQAANPAREQLTSTLNKVRESLFEPYPLAQRGSDAWKDLNTALNKSMLGKDAEALQAARTVMDRVRKGSVNADEAITQLKGLSVSGKSAQETLDFVKKTIKTPDFVLRQSPQALKSASQNIGDLLNQKGPTGAKINEAIARELSIVKKSLDRQISKAEPAYGQYMQTFRDMSKPVNQHEVAQEILKKSTSPTTDALGNPTVFANKLAEALRSGDKTAAKATGFKRAELDKILSPDQMTKLQNVSQDLSRSQVADNFGRGAGSDTVQKFSMTNLMQRTGLPVGINNFPLIGRAGNFAYAQADDEMRQMLAKALLNPQETAKLMMKSQPGQKAEFIAQLLRHASPVVAGGTAGLLNSR